MPPHWVVECPIRPVLTVTAGPWAEMRISRFPPSCGLKFTSYVGWAGMFRGCKCSPDHILGGVTGLEPTKQCFASNLPAAMNHSNRNNVETDHCGRSSVRPNSREKGAPMSYLKLHWETSVEQRAVVEAGWKPPVALPPGSRA